MVDNLIITEKPSVARDVAISILKKASKEVDCIKGVDHDGKEVLITWARGHLLELAPPQTYSDDYKKWDVSVLPIVPPMPWKFKEVVKSSAKDVFSAAKKHLKDNDGAEVINACDAGREGELIFRKIVDNVGLKSSTFSRMWFSSMTKAAILDAYKKRGSLSKYDGLAMSGYTRDQADWVVGMNMSVLATKTLPRGSGDWKVWSVGRVQTPTLALVVERDQYIKAFKPEKFWEVYGNFESMQGKSVLDEYHKNKERLTLLGESKNKDNRKVFWEKDLAETYKNECEKNKKYKVTDKKTISISKSPLPLDLQEAQKICSKKYGTTGALTLSNLQKLYEMKLISYPRTDSRYFNEDMKDSLYNNISKVINELKSSYPDLPVCKQTLMSRSIADSSKAYNDKKVGDHYALCPTGETKGITELDSHLLNVYVLVLQQAVMSLDEDAKYDVVTRTWDQETPAGDKYSPTQFKATKKSVNYAGWTRWKGELEEGVVELPELKGDCELLNSIEIKEGETTPPKHFDDGTLLDAMKFAGTHFEDIDDEREEELIDAMKDRGLGTPATRTAIIEKLIQRNYLKRDRKTILSTPNGEKLINELKDVSPISISAQQTAEWEFLLNKMEKNDKTAPSRESFLDNLLAEFKKTMKDFVTKRPPTVIAKEEVDGETCPKSGKPVLDCGKYYQFPGYPKLRLFKEGLGRKFSIQDYRDILNAAEKGEDHYMDMKSKDGKEFQAQFRLAHKNTKLELEFKSREVESKTLEGYKCPKTEGKIEDCGIYYIFEGYPKIKFYKKAFGKEFSVEEYCEIIETNIKGDPKEWDLYSEKKKRKYKAKILIESDSKLRLAF